MHPLETRDVAAASIIRECSDRDEGVDTGSGKAVWLDTPMIEKIGGEGHNRKTYSGDDENVCKLRNRHKKKSLFWFIPHCIIKTADLT